MTRIPFQFDLTTGSVNDDGLRYVLMRPDVLMGAARQLGRIEAFVAAFEEAAYAHGRASFEAYRDKGIISEGNFLARTAEFAASLGWGCWGAPEYQGQDIILRVDNSPFAVGFGSGDIPVCGPIVGILRALFLVAAQTRVTVREAGCACQGNQQCTFVITKDEAA